MNNDEKLLSRLAPVTDAQAAAMVSRQALNELGDEIIRTEPHRTEPHRRPALQDRRQSALQHRPQSGLQDRPQSGLQHRPQSGHGSRIRRSRRLPLAVGAAALAAAAAVAVALIIPAGNPAPGGKIAQNHTSRTRPPSASAAPSGPATLDAWTVTERGDGTVKVTIREMDDPAGLQAKLRADGVRVVVTASLAWPAACGEWRGGNFRLGDQVLRSLNRTGLPTTDGTEFIIRPSLIPSAALLWLGISQTGKPNGVVGPPGPMSASYLTATRTCASS
jgi:hypothetical protein